MIEYINSPFIQQLLIEHPEYFLFAGLMVSGTLIFCFSSMSAWFQVHITHYPARPAPQSHPLTQARPGYYYVDTTGRVFALGGELDSDQDESATAPAATTPLTAASPRRKNRPKISVNKRFRILQRDGFRCQLCGRSREDGEHVRLHVDHRMPLAQGGSNDEANLWTLCEECNLAKSDKIIDEILERLHDASPRSEDKADKDGGI